jgi:H+/Cl- antiporter ClcA
MQHKNQLLQHMRNLCSYSKHVLALSLVLGAFFAFVAACFYKSAFTSPQYHTYLACANAFLQIIPGVICVGVICALLCDLWSKSQQR